MIFAIDFGTSNSLIACYLNNKVEIIPNERGERLTPTAISFKSDEEVYIGEIAKQQSVIEAANTVLNIKRQLGSGHEFFYNGRSYRPSELAALVLKKLKNHAKKTTGEKVKKIVLSVPAYFNNLQRQDLLHAAYLAGLEVVQLINEPTAAALAYQIEGKKKILVVDFGGGTLDISYILGENLSYKVKAVSGNNHMGGIDYDLKFADFIIEKYLKEFNIDLKQDEIAYQQILNNAERIKKDLSSAEEIDLAIPYISVTEKGQIHIKEKVTRESFKEQTQSLTQSILNTLNKFLDENEITGKDIDCLIFAGGGTRICGIADSIKNAVLKEKSKIKFLSHINQDEVVVYGAAVYAGILEKKIKDIDFYDVTSHSLGILDHHERFVELIPKNTLYPVSADKIFTTVEDNQEEVYIPVCQKDDSSELIYHGELALKNLPHAKGGEVKISVIFNMDKNCVLQIKAVEMDTLSHSHIELEVPFVKRVEKKSERRGQGIKII